ncbi:MAG: hypothetical protein PHF63_00730 [Herbinix sp.]|nr:hypothetical protein [Herbinix sp.]
MGNEIITTKEHVNEVNACVWHKFRDLGPGIVIRFNPKIASKKQTEVQFADGTRGWYSNSELVYIASIGDTGKPSYIKKENAHTEH